MGRYTQSNRPLAIRTPLGPDALLLTKLIGSEAISEPYFFTLDLLAEQPIDFNRLLGQKAGITLTLPNGSGRSIHGILRRVVQGPKVPAADGKDALIRYRAELVPEFWLLSQRLQSRIFQHLSVPDILKQVLHDEWRLDLSVKLTGTYQPRNYCVQYRETDLAFVSRLMEDEGISYYFRHSAEGHTLVLVDDQAAFGDFSRFGTVNFEPALGGPRPEPRILDWEKDQEIRPSRHTLWDYSFQVPNSNLEARQDVPAQAAVGTVEHRITHAHMVNGVDMLETFDYPAGYAWRFDGISKDGIDQPPEVEKLFTDNQRTAGLRGEREAVAAVTIRGSGDCGHFLPGHLFTLARHYDGDGAYLITRVEQTASLEGAYVTGEPAPISYQNHFECVPADLRFRPPRATPQPKIEGPQTAVVVGPAGQEIFLDKYGRVKVKFRWDRQGGNDASCWVRVAQFWAGKTWGAFFWPRIGHEVVVVFEEGDPDRPLIAGSLYNADNMPPYELPMNSTVNGIKSCIAQGDPAANFNAVVFFDTPGLEYVQVHSEKNEISHSESTRVSAVAYTQYCFNGMFGR